ncbi:MxaK protein, partial [Methylobacterium sp. J-001]|nr:MxaK protein [Methylobacterium sp. J-001]
REAFGLLTRGALDKAGPQVTLARQDYRRALRDRPDFWDAKFNLDVAWLDAARMRSRVRAAGLRDRASDPPRLKR